MNTITTEEALTLAQQLEANEPMLQDPVALEFFADVATALRSLAAERDLADEQIKGLSEERERWKDRAEKAEAEAERLKAAFRTNAIRWNPGLSHAEINAEIERILNQGGDDGGEKAHQDAAMYGTGILIDGKHVKPEDFYLSIDEARARNRAREEGEK